MSLKISKPGRFESPRAWRMKNGLDSPEWDMYANLSSAWALRVSFIFFVIGVVIGSFL